MDGSFFVLGCLYLFHLFIVSLIVFLNAFDASLLPGIIQTIQFLLKRGYVTRNGTTNTSVGWVAIGYKG